MKNLIKALGLMMLFSSVVACSHTPEHDEPLLDVLKGVEATAVASNPQPTSHEVKCPTVPPWDETEIPQGFGPSKGTITWQKCKVMQYYNGTPLDFIGKTKCLEMLDAMTKAQGREEQDRTQLRMYWKHFFSNENEPSDL